MPLFPSLLRQARVGKRFTQCVWLALLSPTLSLAAAPGATVFSPPSVQRGQSMKVAVGDIKPWPVTAWTDDAGLTVKAEEKPGHVTITASDKVEPGVHWLRLLNADGAGPPQPFWVDTIPEVAEKEPNNTLGKSQQLSSAQVAVTGKLDPAGDVDTFAFDLKAGEQVVLAVQANRPFMSAVDCVLQVVDVAGFVLAQDNDFVGLDPRITFTAPKAGVYHARLFGFPEVATSAIAFGGGDKLIYRLTVSAGPFVDYAWPLSVSRSSPAQVQLCGERLPEAGRKLSLNTAAPGNILRVFHDQAAGSTTVKIVDSPVIVEQEPNDRAHAQPITLPTVITGRCEQPGDEDVFVLTGVKNKKLVAKVESRSLGFVMDPFLTLFDAEGKVLKTADDAKDDRDGELFDVLRTEDQFRVAVRDLYGKGSPRHVYQLTVQFEQSDFELTAAASEYAIAAKKPLEIPITIERRGGFDQPIRFTVRGLPEGVKVDAPEALVKGETAKSVKLKLTADKPWSGPIEILGQGALTKTAAEPSVTHSTGLTLAATGERWTQIWLTVTK